MRQLIFILLFGFLVNGMETKNKPDRDDWSIFIEALIFVESRGNDSLIGKNNDVGCLQITPIIIKSANQIIGHEKYSLEDRFSRKKSIEIFNIVQSKHNFGKDKHFALKIWNPKSSISYHTKVIDKYLELKKDSSTSPAIAAMQCYAQPNICLYNADNKDVMSGLQDNGWVYEQVCLAECFKLPMLFVANLLIYRVMGSSGLLTTN